MVEIVTIGIVVLDDVLPIAVPLVPGEKHRARRIETVVGGNAANAARAIARLKGRARLIARIGDDAAGRELQARLEQEGIDLSLSQVVEGTATSRSAVIVEPDGARTIVNHLDPALPDQPAWLPGTLPANTAVVLGDTRWEAGARHLFIRARRAGIPAVFDGDRKPQDLELIDLASHVVFSEQGLAELSGSADAAEGLARVARGRSGFYAVTAGSAGVYSFQAGRVRHHPGFPVVAVDTLGAGDVWHGAFALGLGEGMGLDRAIDFASAAAALKCTRPGGGAGAPHRHEVDDFLARHGAGMNGERRQ
ncbi:MAG: PfkB family carbohydrate kinase [Proteobacteria bacterium]|nr:PfkB family carbohydrate kinase [Pseudomonadota bacterium]